MSNKFQYADIVYNEDQVVDVQVLYDELHVVFQVDPPEDFEWVTNFLNKKGYEYKGSELITQNVQKAIFKTEVD